MGNLQEEADLKQTIQISARRFERVSIYSAY